MEDFFSWSRFFSNIPRLAAKLPLTFEIVAVAFVFGTILALLLAVLQLRKIPVVEQIVRVFISFERGTPMLVQLLVVYYALPLLLESLFDVDTRRWARIQFVFITFVLNQGAFLCETFRAAILAVPKIQSEAAFSCGLTSRQTFFRIVLPQSLRIAVPGVGMDLLGLFQETSLLFMIGVIDILGLAQAIGSNTGHSIEAYLITALFFIIINLFLRKILNVLEGKLNVF